MKKFNLIDVAMYVCGDEIKFLVSREPISELSSTYLYPLDVTPTRLVNNMQERLKYKVYSTNNLYYAITNGAEELTLIQRNILHEIAEKIRITNTKMNGENRIVLPEEKLIKLEKLISDNADQDLLTQVKQTQKCYNLDELNNCFHID